MFFALKSPLLLYPFRYFDTVRNRWIRARYVAERHVIESTYAQWEIMGPPEIRTGSATMFSPSAALPPLKRRAHLPPLEEPPPDRGPTPDLPPVEEPPLIEDQIERFLVLLFLRRYVTWCARCRRFAQMEGATDLHRQVAKECHRV